MSDGNKPGQGNYANPNSTLKKLFILKSNPALLGILTFAIFASLFGLLAYQRFLMIKDGSQSETNRVLYDAKEKLHELLEQGVSTTTTLSYFIQKDGDIKEFDSIASHILASNKNIDALELVPGGVIKKIYPLKGNEAVLGYDILSDSKRSSEAKKAIREKSFFYAGPLELRQGGIGIVGRLPVFIKDTFWGFSSVVIKLPELLKSAGIDSLNTKGYYFQLSKINPDSHVEESFILHPRHTGSDNFVSVYMPNEEWKLSAKPVNDNQRYVDFYLLALLSFIFSTVLGIIVFFAAKRPEKLNKLIQLRTDDVVKKEKKYRSLIEQASDGIVIIDNAGKIVEMNQSAGKITGYSEPEILGRQLEDFLLVDGVNSQPLRTNELLEGVTIVYERKIQKKDGSIIDVEVNSKMADKDTFIGFIRDITDRKHAKLLLEQSEIKYRSLFAQASDGIIITNLAGIILEVNNSICIMGGYDVDEMIGRHATEFMPEEDITKKPLRIDDLISGKILLYERRMQKKDGTVIDVEINSKMTITKTLIGFVRDITERKKAAFELKRSIEQYELVAKATNDAIWDYDVNSDIADGNENLYAIYGLKQGVDKINYQLLLSRTHPDDREILAASFSNAIDNKHETLEKEFRFQISDGSYRHIFDRACFKYDENGQLVRILGVMQDISDRIKYEQTLLIEKELSDSIINNLPAAFFLITEQGKFLRWNTNLEIASGYTTEEIAALDPFKLVVEGEWSNLSQKIKNVFVTGADVMESSFIKKSGKIIPCYITGIKVEYQGQICLMGFGLDFSEKVASEKRIIESEQKFRALVEHASDSVVILSAQGNPLYVSPSLERIIGYTEAEMLQMNVSDLTHPDEAEAIGKVFQKVMENPGVPIKGHYSKIRHKDGSWRWFEDTITNMLHDPAINGIVENIRDVTEKLEIEKKIIAEKELSDSVINNLPGIFYIYDKTGKFIRWNKNFETVTGYNADEIRHMHPLDFYDDDVKQMLAERIESNFLRKNAGVELSLFTKAKQKIPYYYNSHAIKYEDTPCIMGMGIDVSDRKVIERELLKSNQQLEYKATELKDSYAELERFAYIVSHDLQEPLRMVSSFLKLIEQKYKSQLDEKGEKYIHFAVDGAERMKQLIMDLLEYSRTGTNTDSPDDTNMKDVVDDVLNVLRNSILEHGAIVETGNLPVLPDTSRILMFQLMQNLVGNALKYHSDKKPVIKIDVTDNGSHWEFSVKDNGIGIDSQYAEKIFVIFQRLHGKDEYSGTGIGLAICKKIVDKLGGKIWVSSASGLGSTFYFTVPKHTISIKN